MTIYAEVKRFDGTKFGRVRVIGDADPIPIGSQHRILFIDLTDVIPIPEIKWYYDRSTNIFSETLPSGAVVPKETLTAAEFWLGRFTDNERSDVWALCNGETVSGVTITQRIRYRLAAFRDVTLAGEPVPLHAAKVEAVVNGLETAGLLDPGRAAEILA